MEINMKKKILLYFIGILVVVILVELVLLGITLKQTMDYKAVVRNIELGDKYVVELDYENAELSYLKAIDIDEKNIEPYLRLADVYIKIKQFDRAYGILEDAKAFANNDTMREIDLKYQEVVQAEQSQTDDSDEQNSIDGQHIVREPEGSFREDGFDLKPLIINRKWDLLCITDENDVEMNLDELLGDNWCDLEYSPELSFYAFDSDYSYNYGLILPGYTDGEMDGMLWNTYSWLGDRIFLFTTDDLSFGNAIWAGYRENLDYHGYTLETVYWIDEITDRNGNTAEYKIYFADEYEMEKVFDKLYGQNLELKQQVESKANSCRMYALYDHTGTEIDLREIYGEDLWDCNELSLSENGTYELFRGNEIEDAYLYGKISYRDDNRIVLTDDDSRRVMTLEYVRLDKLGYNVKGLHWIDEFGYSVYAIPSFLYEALDTEMEEQYKIY